jgi:hypothetical protein
VSLRLDLPAVALPAEVDYRLPDVTCLDVEVIVGESGKDPDSNGATVDL